MKSSLYLLNLSFHYPCNLDKEDFTRRIQVLEEDISYMLKNSQEIFKNDSIYEEPLIGTNTLCDCLYNRDSEGYHFLKKDTRLLLMKIIDKAKPTDKNNEEIINEIKSETSEEICGLICLNEIEGIDKKYLIYHKQNWLDFHRIQMGIHIVDTGEYLEDAKKYFPNIFFHANNHMSIQQIDGGFLIFRKVITTALSKVNDKFQSIFDNSDSLPDCLRKFSIVSNIETTNEGNKQRKPDFTYIFKNKEICCESHMKLSRSDNYPGDSKFYYNRIYFHPGKPELFNKKILVGHIGKHL